tara:strand:+ start:141 stop:521 length:381 start_codon:yes stop_codon:yes gene_type:complete
MHPGERLSLRFAVALLALLSSVTLRALIPVGYMPDVADDGFHLVICSATAPADTHHDPDHKGSTDAGPVCAFAAVAMVTGADNPPPLPRPVVPAIVRESGFALRDPPSASRSEGPPPPARAPPLSI